MGHPERITSAYRQAKNVYADWGVDTEQVLKQFLVTPVSIPCWQGDDIGGFEQTGGGASGGILVTGNYPGLPRTPEELRRDMEKAISYIPGAVRINLHASYGEDFEPGIDRDEYAPRHFARWIDWAKGNGVALDFNCTTFGHPKATDDLTISHPNEQIRSFWVRHLVAARRIAAHMGDELKTPCVYNIWVQDGSKEIPAHRLLYRQLLKDSLDRVLAEKLPETQVYDALESKLFAIGVESYTVGSSEFYLGYHSYARARGLGNTIINLDMGHFHPTESIADKISSVLLFSAKIMAHFTRGVRWDSDHVVVGGDEVDNAMREIVRCGALQNTFLGTDYFDATINRVAAWAIGTRATKRALLAAMLEPVEHLRRAELAGDKTTRLALTEQFRWLPSNAVWEYACLQEEVAPDNGWLDDLRVYERNVQLKR